MASTNLPVYKIKGISDARYSRTKSALESLPVYVTEFYNGTSGATVTDVSIRRFRGIFLHNYTPAMLLAAVVYARLQEIEEYWEHTPSAILDAAQRIRQTLETTFNDPRDQQRGITIIAKIAGFLLVTYPTAQHFAGQGQAINSPLAAVTASGIGYWLQWEGFRRMFLPLVSRHSYQSFSRQPLTGEELETEIRCVTEAQGLLSFYGPVDVWAEVTMAANQYTIMAYEGTLYDPPAPAQAGPSQPQPRGRSSSRPPGSRSSSRSSGRAGPSRSERRSSSRR